MVYPVRQNLIEAATLKGGEMSGKRDELLFFPSASPENSSTSTLCLLVDTVTGTEREPGEGD